MAAPDVPRPPKRTAESLDDYLPDSFGGFAEAAPSPAKRANDDGTAGLGIDEEVSVKKRAREPRVKLDEARLLSEKGIPALRKRARLLKLKGKGHEFSDAARLLSMYQLWLDDLFPKARFADALVMVEKEGHKASMHKMRMEWINESKPKDVQGDDERASEPAQESAQEPAEQNQPLSPSLPQPRQQPQQPQQPQETQASAAAGAPPDDLLDDDLFDEALFDGTAGASVQNVDDVPDESELDAMMAEAMAVHEPAGAPPPPPPPPRMPSPPQADDFDDLDALIAEAEAAT